MEPKPPKKRRKRTYHHCPVCGCRRTKTYLLCLACSSNPTNPLVRDYLKKIASGGVRKETR